MNIALDIGTHEIRSLRCSDGRLIARRCRSVSCTLDDSDSHRAILAQIGVPFAICDRQLVVFGEEADKLTGLFRVPRGELFPNGEIPCDDPPVRQLVAAIVESLIGRTDSADALCCLTLPGEKKNSGGDWSDSSSLFLKRLVELQGYTPGIISAPHALVLSELGGNGFTGIGMVFGAGTSEAALVHNGNELARCAVPYAGNWIDLRLARSNRQYVWDANGEKFLDTAVSQSWKEAFSGTIVAPRSKEERLLTDLNRGMVEFLLQQATETFVPVLERMRLPASLPTVVAGGSARVPGFDQLFLDVVTGLSIPIGIGMIHMAAEDDLSIARGGLIRAELERAEEFEFAAA